MKTKTKSDNQRLRSLLKKEGAIPKAIDALIRGLTAKRSFAQGGRTVTEDDASTQVKAALGLLQWSASPPPRVSKDVEPTARLSEAEREQEVERILGITYDHPGHGHTT